MAAVIGIDVGSQSLKGVVADEDGRVLASASAPLTISCPQPARAEQDPLAWESGLQEVTGSLLSAARLRPADVVVLCVAAQLDAVVAVTAAGEPLGPALIWLDRRAQEQADKIAGKVGPARLARITGLTADASHAAPKIAWLADSCPPARRAFAFCSAASYLTLRLTGALVTDHANASSTLLYDIGDRCWHPELLAAAGVEARQLGVICDSQDVAGTLTAAAARTLGLTTRCRVLAGTGDDHAAAIAAGAVRPGVVADVTGTAEPVGTACAAPVPDPLGLLETHAHAVPGRYFVQNPGFVSGGSTLWLAGVLATSQAEVLELAAAAAPGAGGVRFIPALSGSMSPRWNSRMRGTFAGLSMTSGRAELTRAVLEGCCFALRDVADRIAALGLPCDVVRVVGGGARSSGWLQAKADITGRTVQSVAGPHPTAAGAALIAAVAAGTAADLEAAVDRRVTVAQTCRPDPALAGLYADAYDQYRALFDGVESAVA